MNFSNERIMIKATAVVCTDSATVAASGIATFDEEDDDTRPLPSHTRWYHTTV